MNRIGYLESLVSNEIQEKYLPSFEKYATYMGNGVYHWRGINGTSPREVFLLVCLHNEKIPYEIEEEFIEDESNTQKE